MGFSKDKALKDVSQSITTCINGLEPDFRSPQISETMHASEDASQRTRSTRSEFLSLGSGSQLHSDSSGWHESIDSDYEPMSEDSDWWASNEPKARRTLTQIKSNKSNRLPNSRIKSTPLKPKK